MCGCVWLVRGWGGAWWVWRCLSTADDIAKAVIIVMDIAAMKEFYSLVNVANSTII